MPNKALPYLLLTPALLFLLVFFLYPFVQIAVLAFSGPDGFTMSHFQRMATHWKFGTALTNTLILTAIIVPVQLALALSMASIVTRLKTGRNTILYIFAIPLGLSDLAAGIIWLAIFEQSGFLNSLLVGLGVTDQPQLFLGYQNIGWIFAAVIIAEIWRATAIMMVILVSGMGIIPKEYYEAAEVFGASPWKRFWKVTLPLLRPSLQTALILRTIAAFEVFAVVVALGGTTLPVLMGETYQWQFALRDRSVAASYALVILVISIAATLVFLRMLRVPREARI
ncbi:carbohydrate ABC transporter permease [Pelagibacterium halotolerans]|uniref:Sugar ABC transporter, permease protein n=1 Tax=Pelagibacterium halotolerans (strain DSM 22347 / JCM 15775 / CGMCC 1.7692 / B2) TaxID=1082931 RepID=G4RBM5_PELHB|nr:sugar ABC transporter permease [Pelagibacterium halotolerans]AEQ53666.1 sugar ABC transporter, permease protein [Pelagibacterium halotolerans B2]QJR20165.1 sugar ABC transporter permease [Pelagibacterium halotolerans]SEA90699.1 carbohydrate ABC transporter membrane protein 1, CUT1 family [Pelagibacterium halotolerans]